MQIMTLIYCCPVCGYSWDDTFSVSVTCGTCECPSCESPVVAVPT